MAEKKAKPAAKKTRRSEPQAAREGGFTPAERAGGPGAATEHPPEERKSRDAGSPGDKPRAAGSPRDKPRAAGSPRDKRVRWAASPKVKVVNAANETVREIQLSPDVFAADPNPHLVYEAVKQYRAGGRSGTHMTKNRALVSGSGKKPWRQKGTGRARAGETRSPLWRHGGTAFGPQPRDYSYSMPRKARAAALRVALSQRLVEGAVKVVEALVVDEPKTKLLKSLLAGLGVAGKALVVDHEPADALVLSGRNLHDVKVVADSHLTAYDVMDCKHLVVTQEAIDKLEERLALPVRE